MLSKTSDHLAFNLTQQAERLLQAGRHNAARTVIAALRRGAPRAEGADEIEARLNMAEDMVPDALHVLHGAIARDPRSPALRLLRAEARSRMDDHSGAAVDAAEASLLAPEDARPKAMLGLIMIELDRLPDAAACLHDAVRQAPSLGAAWRGLAEVMTRLGDPLAAAAVHDAAIANVPNDPRLRLAALMAAMRDREFDRALAIGLAARRDGLADACIFGLLGHALSKLGRHEEASEHYQDALRLAPEDPYVRHLVRAAGLLPGADRAPPLYLEAVFDGYADHFDEHLTDLGYRVPGELRDAIVRLMDDGTIASLGEVLDLGCGTGLVGLFLSDLPMKTLTGVDISENMIAKARAKGIYGDLIVADLVPYVDRACNRWDVVLGGDVFCYFGALEKTMSSIHQALRPGGLLVCNVEHDETVLKSDWKLESQGRYVHTGRYIRTCLAEAGFELIELRPETLRFEAGAPVAGLIITAQKIAHHA